MSNNAALAGSHSLSSAKDFAEILSEYDFFRAHASEYVTAVQYFSKQLHGLLKPNFAVLDFGGADGRMLYDLFEGGRLGTVPVLKIGFIEPALPYRLKAQKLLAKLSPSELTVAESLSPSMAGQYDVILSNHVLYYVPDLKECIQTMLKTLSHRGGEIWISMASDRNELNRLGQTLYAALGEKMPFNQLSDLLRILAQEKIPYSTEELVSQFRCKDTQTNRTQLIKFVLGDHASANAIDPSNLALLDPYRRGDSIEVHLSDVVVRIKKSGEK